ncbi:MAG: hypothetical protein M0R77_02465 [Gammaproteobacteria bacterium]|nr:hypothetical protein [Gammaproteobacteria bacterium]
MIPDLITVLTYYHPGINATNGGDLYDYNDIVWDDPQQAIPENQLLSEQVTLTKIYKKRELDNFTIGILETQGMWYQSHHFDVSIYKRSIYSQVATSLLANGSLSNFSGCFDTEYNFIAMDYTQFIAFNNVMADYISGVCTWQVNQYIAIDALTDSNSVDAYDYMSSLPSNDTDGTAPN